MSQVLEFTVERAKQVSEMCIVSGQALVPNFEGLVEELRGVQRATNSEAVKTQVDNLEKLKEQRVEPSARLYTQLGEAFASEAKNLERMESH